MGEVRKFPRKRPPTVEAPDQIPAFALLKDRETGETVGAVLPNPDNPDSLLGLVLVSVAQDLGQAYDAITVAREVLDNAG